ncbi:MAG: M14 family metallopeptidase [Acidobacteriota bacterium]|nr:M14 family metallopeptidase [Acidobacteriota bacterium]
MKAKTSILPVLPVLICFILTAGTPLKPKVTPPDPHFNRLNHNTVIYDALKGYNAAYPDWTKLESLGKTLGGGDTWLLTINNPATGKPDDKPAFYIDGAIHANEAQSADTVLYIIDFLFKNYGKLPKITETMDRAVFYIIPIVSPDSRVKWFDEPATPHYPRTVQIAIDDDRDGALDEDGFDDLNGDGEITMMRKKVPLGQGNMKLHPKDSRLLVPLEPHELGDYIMIGTEGIDNDGDGRLNEDTVGYIDPNRTWGYNWQPRYVQAGAPQYPLQIPETRNIAMWAAQRPNIAAIQSFHNYGRMILRGPGSKDEKPFPTEDIQVLDFFGKEGEKMMPGYNYYISWKDLYTVYGGTTEHFYGIHGALSFTNELNGTEQDFDKDGKVSPEEKMKFNDQLTMGRMFVDWKPYKHPTYGDIEIGGYRHDTERPPEGWRLEEDCHRNCAFVMLHAYHLPKLEFAGADVEKLDGNLYKIYVSVRNSRAMHSRSYKARREKLTRPDIATLSGGKVLASGVVNNRFTNNIKMQKHRPERLMVEGVDGRSVRMLYFLVEGKGDLKFNYDSQHGGKLQGAVTLR